MWFLGFCFSRIISAGVTKLEKSAYPPLDLSMKRVPLRSMHQKLRNKQAIRLLAFHSNFIRHLSHIFYKSNCGIDYVHTFTTNFLITLEVPLWFPPLSGGCNKESNTCPRSAFQHFNVTSKLLFLYLEYTRIKPLTRACARLSIYTQIFNQLGLAK